MEKGIKQTNTLYNIFCICICLLIWALSYFQGHVYISPNGYAVLNDNLLNPIGIDEKGRAEQSVMHEMILNGGHFNLIYTGGEEYLGFPEGGLHFQGTGFWDDNTYFMDFYIIKETGDSPYEIYDIWPHNWPVQYLRSQRMICDFITAQWHNFNIFGYARMEGGHPLRMIFVLVLVLLLRSPCLHLIQKWQGSEKKMKCYRLITYTSFSILQFTILILATLQFVTFIP